MKDEMDIDKHEWMFVSIPTFVFGRDYNELFIGFAWLFFSIKFSLRIWGF